MTKKRLGERKMSRSHLRNNFKNTEREVARILGGKRVPVTGRHSGDVEDVEHVDFCPEVKCRQGVTAVVAKAMAQAKLAVKRNLKEGKVKMPIVVIHHWGKPHRLDEVIMEMSDFIQILRRAGYSIPTEEELDAMERERKSRNPARSRADRARDKEAAEASIGPREGGTVPLEIPAEPDGRDDDLL